MMRRIDLLPPSYLQRRRERSSLVIVAVAAALVVLLLIGWWFFLGLRVNDAEEELRRAQDANAELDRQIQDLQRFVLLENEVNAKRTSLQTVMTGDIDWPGILAEIAMVIPGEVWLTNLTASAGTTEGATAVPTETSPIPLSDLEPFGRIQFQGQSLSMAGVAKWMLRLEGVDSFFATYLQNATAGQAEGGGGEVVSFGTTIELTDEAASRRFQQRLAE
ncbi:MAG: PilN domain-containing protein [Actinobacteria bacterium]|nr:PilN domain-containing protein [Actinomycetota bacterium]